MKRYQLAKIISWAGRLNTRKRLQKVVYLLQSVGCPIEADYSLLLYGPYSEELARLTDEMVRLSFLEEEVSENAKGRQYAYRLSDAVKQNVNGFEKTPKGQALKAELAGYELSAKELLSEDLKQLEYASTIVYFFRQGCDWNTAVKKAVQFKGTQAVKDALPLAKKYVT